MSDTQIDPFAMTPEQAGEQLAKLEAEHRGPQPTTTPTTPAEASVRLRMIAADKGWGERYLAGSQAERREFQALTALAASGGDQATGSDDVFTVTNAVDDPHAVNQATYAGMFDALRAQGLPDTAEQIMRQIDAGQRTDRPTAGDGLAAKQAIDRLSRDPAWARAVMDGDIQANNLMNGLNRLIAYAADDGQPITDVFRDQLKALGLR